MTLSTYKMLHLVGLFMTFMAWGALLTFRYIGAKKSKRKIFKSIMPTHGVGLLLAFVGGFGMLAKQGLHSSLPAWVLVKIAIWLFLGGAVVIIKKKPGKAIVLWWVLIGLAITASYLGIMKPF